MKNKIKLCAAAVGIGLTTMSAVSGLAPGAQGGQPDALCAAQAQDPAGAPFDHIVLVHRFTIPPRMAWGKVSVELAPEAWHVGGADGPLASAAQLRGTLRALGGIEVGGRCAGRFDGATAYPCGFAVRELGLAAQAGDRVAGIAMDWTTDPIRVQAASDTRPQTVMKAGVAAVADTTRFVGLRVAPHQLGAPERAFGHTLEFEIRAVPNLLMPSVFDRANGMVTLCGAGQDKAT
jgi:hypothetical protein